MSEPIHSDADGITMADLRAVFTIFAHDCGVQIASAATTHAAEVAALRALVIAQAELVTGLMCRLDTLERDRAEERECRRVQPILAMLGGAL